LGCFEIAEESKGKEIKSEVWRWRIQWKIEVSCNVNLQLPGLQELAS
jgi:hypothetical protein